MKIHPREKLVEEAEHKIRGVVFDATKDLTLFERVQVVARVLNGELLSTCKYQIRYERHGNTDTPGGAAPVEEDKEQR